MCASGASSPGPPMHQRTAKANRPRPQPQSPRLLGSKFGCRDNRGVGQTGVSEAVLVPGGGDGGRISVHVVHLDVGAKSTSEVACWPRDADRWGTVHNQCRWCGNDRLVRAVVKGDQACQRSSRVSALREARLPAPAVCSTSLSAIAHRPPEPHLRRHRWLRGSPSAGEAH